MFSAQITELKGDVITHLRDFKRTEVVIPLCDSRTAKTTLSIYNPALLKLGMGILAPMSKMLKIHYNGHLVFWGRILLPVWKANEGTVELSCIDSSVMYKKHYHTFGCRAVDYGYFIDGSGMWTLAESVEPLQTQKSPRLGAGVYFGIDTTVHQPHVKPTKGLEPGEGEGAFRKVARGDNIWESIVNMSQLEGPPAHVGGTPIIGPDFELVPVDAENPPTTIDRHHSETEITEREWQPYFHAQINTADRIGTDRSSEVVWHCGWGRNNLKDFEYAPNGDEIQNYAVAVNPGGPRSSGDFTSRAGSHNPDSWKEYGILGAWITAGQVDSLPVLQAAADARVQAYAWPLEGITIYPRRQGEFESGPVGKIYRYIDDYKVGDVISASVKKGALQFRGSGRITQVTLKQVEEGNSLEGIEELLVIPEIASGEAETGDDLAGLDGG